MGKVMIVDDSPQYLELMATVLASYGHAVVTLSKAKDALEAVMLASPDLLIMDVRLGSGDMSGLDVIVGLNEEGTSHPLPVLVCTADSLENDSRSNGIIQRYGLSVLYKPFDMPDFLSKVEELLSSSERCPAIPKKPWID